jgi:hypothetical protein
MALKLIQQRSACDYIGQFTMSVADSVDGLAYSPDAGGNLVVATASTQFCVYLDKRAKVGDKVSGVWRGVVIAKASGAIAAFGPATTDAAGKIKAGVIGTDHIIGFCGPIAATADGDMVSLFKVG